MNYTRAFLILTTLSSEFDMNYNYVISLSAEMEKLSCHSGQNDRILSTIPQGLYTSQMISASITTELLK